MRVVTISREFGSGGREMGKRMADILACADTAAKVKRCMERAPKDEKLAEKELVHKMRQIDKMRAQTRVVLSDSEWGHRNAYHLTVNTSERSIKDMAIAVAAFADCWLGGR